MLVNVSPAGTTATFMFGVEMTVTAKGITQVVTRPSWQVVTLAGNAPRPAGAGSRRAASLLKGPAEAVKAQPGSGDADEAAEEVGLHRQEFRSRAVQRADRCRCRRDRRCDHQRRERRQYAVAEAHSSAGDAGTLGADRAGLWYPLLNVRMALGPRSFLTAS